jgi:hypothetical protein
MPDGFPDAHMAQQTQRSKVTQISFQEPDFCSAPFCSGAATFIRSESLAQKGVETFASE